LGSNQERRNQNPL